MHISERLIASAVRACASRQQLAALGAALWRLERHALTAGTPPTEEALEVNERMHAILPCVKAQVQAAQLGSPARSSAGLVPADQHVMSNAAKHEFTSTFASLTPGIARKLQRGAGKGERKSKQEPKVVHNTDEQLMVDGKIVTQTSCGKKALDACPLGVSGLCIAEVDSGKEGKQRNSEGKDMDGIQARQHGDIELNQCMEQEESTDKDDKQHKEKVQNMVGSQGMQNGDVVGTGDKLEQRSYPLVSKPIPADYQNRMLEDGLRMWQESKLQNIFDGWQQLVGDDSG